jgi:hypothetical protein
MRPLLRFLFAEHRVAGAAIAFHDHTVDDVLPDGSEGVTCTVQRGTACGRHPLVCPCTGQCARLHTCVVGSRMADGIAESAFSRGLLERVAERQSLRVRRYHPVPWRMGDDTPHWLLHSLTLAFVSEA